MWVSCPSATDFSAILFFIQIRQRVKNFPIDPHCKICPLSATLLRCRKRKILQWGSMGKFFICCRIQSFRVRLKRWNDRGEFELDRTKSKNNTAEYSIALGHDTHNSSCAAYLAYYVLKINQSYFYLINIVNPQLFQHK